MRVCTGENHELPIYLWAYCRGSSHHGPHLNSAPQLYCNYEGFLKLRQGPRFFGVRDINVTVWVGSFFVAPILTYLIR